MTSAAARRATALALSCSALLLPSSLLAVNPSHPNLTSDCRPWTYWWWMGSAVDTNNITSELTNLEAAGFGGAHIIPIYGAEGWEDRAIPFLSPQWMEMLDFTVKEAHRIGLQIDMTTGSGWCFGGPTISDHQANALVQHTIETLNAGQSPTRPSPRQPIQAWMAYGPHGQSIDLLPRAGLPKPGRWTAPSDGWDIYTLWQKPSGQKVKRAAPGGTGHMLNLFSFDAIHGYLQWFDSAFDNYKGAMPRAMYHDSYEYRSDWAPELLAAFEKRRGYSLLNELPALFGHGDPDHAARVKSDYRETLSDLMVEVTLPEWHQWCLNHGFITRNEAHGSPGNLLDLYALADIPETEMFNRDRSILVSKFASSAAHVMGRKRVSAETGTWLKEHFQVTLADLKQLVDDLFLSGVNHVAFHGTCYSPDEVPWPGWSFYASTQLNDRNPIWRDLPHLNAYITHVQSVLAAHAPDNDTLLYWPIHDRWHDTNGMVERFTVHDRSWLEEEPVGKTARHLWDKGYAFDFISDRQLALSVSTNARIEVPGGRYKTILVPPVDHMPLETFTQLIALAQSGTTILFENHLPHDVPGLGDLQERHNQLERKKQTLHFTSVFPDLQAAPVGTGWFLVGELSRLLTSGSIPRETFTDQGLQFIRRHDRNRPDQPVYFIVNSSTNAFNDWIMPSRRAISGKSIRWTPVGTELSPLEIKQSHGSTHVRLYLNPGESILLALQNSSPAPTPDATPGNACGHPISLTGQWKLEFLSGGPELPKTRDLNQPMPWSNIAERETEAFSGTARYRLLFDAPPDIHGPVEINLGTVHQSARVLLNGLNLGTVISPPYSVLCPKLEAADNILEVEITSTAANRIRDLDKRGVQWRTFHDINFVNIDYKPFDASTWPVSPAGLEGPVTLRSVESHTTQSP